MSSFFLHQHDFAVRFSLIGIHPTGKGEEQLTPAKPRKTCRLLLVLLVGMSLGTAGFGQPAVVRGAIIRGDTTRPALALVFTGDTFAEGGEHIRRVLAESGVRASFFFTGNFYRDPAFRDLIAGLRADGHYLGAHSDRHLLYCAWENRDSLLVSRREFRRDLRRNYRVMARFGIRRRQAPYFLPPYEWYNDRIAAWTKQAGLTLINYSPGTRSHADYTTPDQPNYVDSRRIYDSILGYEQSRPAGLNGFLLLSHIGVGPGRSDKFYLQLEALINWLKERGYALKRVDELMG